MTSAGALPSSVRDVSLDWVAALLREDHPDVSIASLKIKRAIHGTGTKLQLELSYKHSAGLPKTMWLKAGLDGAHLKKALALGLYSAEAEFYAELLPIVKVPAPRCFAARWDARTGQGVVLLEDLDRPDVTFPGYGNPLSVDLVARGLASLADLHGRSWGKAWLGERNLQEFNEPGSAQERHFRSYTVEYIAEFLNGPVGEAVPAEVHDAKRVYASFWALQPFYRNRPFCLLHTDAHVGNCYVSGSQVAFLDWQLPCQGPWTQDVSYWMAGSLSVQDRRKEEEHLLRDYLHRLRGHGVDAPNFDDAWLGYRRFLAYGYWIWLRNPASMQPLNNNIQLSSRFGPAVADHEVYALLGV